MERVRVSVKCEDCGHKWTQEFRQTEHAAGALHSYRHRCVEVEGQCELPVG